MSDVVKADFNAPDLGLTAEQIEKLETDGLILDFESLKLDEEDVGFGPDFPLPEQDFMFEVQGAQCLGGFFEEFLDQLENGVIPDHLPAVFPLTEEKIITGVVTNYPIHDPMGPPMPNVQATEHVYQNVKVYKYDMYPQFEDISSDEEPPSPSSHEQPDSASSNSPEGDTERKEDTSKA